MPRNLREKIGNILADCDSLGRQEAIRKLEHLVKEEISFLQSEHEIDPVDLTNIHSTAIDIFTSEDKGNISAENFRTWCYVKAIEGFLRNKEYISVSLKVKGRK